MRTKLARICPAALLIAAAGCIGTSEGERAAARCQSVCKDIGETCCEAPAAVEAKLAMPAEGWSWETLAVRAGERARRSGSGSLQALVARLETAEKTAWKDPELRYSRHWGDTSGYGNEPGKSYASGRSDDGDSRTSSIGVRFYVPNPFINHYLKREGLAKVARYEAKADVEAYGVYSEVKMMCLEALNLSREVARCREADAILAKVRGQADGANGVSSMTPYDTIRAQTQFERNRLRLKTKERELFKLHHLIAEAAGVSADGFVLDNRGLELPDPKGLSVDELVKMAFARRPDLAQAMAELEEADAMVGATKAAMIPWFRFVEAGYRHKHGDEDSFEGGFRSRYASDESHERYIEAALTIPLFTWFGGRVSLSNKVRDAADARVQSLYAAIRAEVAGALSRYRDAYEAYDKEGVETFTADMKRRIDECENSGAVAGSTFYRARLELNEYLDLSEDVESCAAEAALALESVIGGSIASVPAEEQSPAAPADEVLPAPDGETLGIRSLLN